MIGDKKDWDNLTSLVRDEIDREVFEYIEKTTKPQHVGLTTIGRISHAGNPLAAQVRQMMNLNSRCWDQACLKP